jgi:hypothetical protein
MIKKLAFVFAGLLNIILCWLGINNFITSSAPIEYTVKDVLAELVEFSSSITTDPTKSIAQINCQDKGCEKGELNTVGGFFWPMYGAASIVNSSTNSIDTKPYKTALDFLKTFDGKFQAITDAAGAESANPQLNYVLFFDSERPPILVPRLI